MTDIQILQRDAFLRFGVLLPISGGIGNSIDNPVIVGKSPNSDINPAFVSKRYLATIFLGRGVEFVYDKQELLEHNGKMIDRITHIIEFEGPEGRIKQKESFYFDVSLYFGNKE